MQLGNHYIFCAASIVLCGVTHAKEIDFARDIRPILSSACFHCHGPDEATREADLRLDIELASSREPDAATLIVPSDPDHSELYRRITAADPDERMPPPDSDKELSASEIELVRQWIAQGGRWSQHWAFVPPERPSVPPVSREGWVRNPIDAFILARLEQEGLQPTEDADSSTLLRRLSLDLIGLPPTVEDSEAFGAGSGASYSNQVERLLESPHYGERWGRVWLDAARYADSDGFEKDKPRTVWMYRDWVVQAFNRDLPYDQFIIEQLAGDLLPNATQDQMVATGFLRNSMLNEEGGIDPEQFRMEAMFDRMDAVGKAILGLTIQCGQCHNHKYDPLTQTDYYRMFAVLNNSHEATVPVFWGEQLDQRNAVLREIREIESRLQRQQPDWRESLMKWARAAKQAQPQWTVLPIKSLNDNSQRYYVQPDHSILAQGYAPTRFTSKFRVETDLAVVRAFRFEGLLDPDLPAGGPGRSTSGLFALTEFKVQVAGVDEPDKLEWVKFTRATADYANSDRRLGQQFSDQQGKAGLTGAAAYAIDGSDDTAWGIDAGPGRRNQRRHALFIADRNIAVEGGTIFTFHLAQKHGGWNSDDNQNMNLGRFRISAAGNVDVQATDWLPAEVADLIQRPFSLWRETDWQRAFAHWRTKVPQWQAENREIERLWRRHPEGTTQLVLSERQQPRDTFRLMRGEFLKPAEAVLPGVPEYLHSWDGTGLPDRLDLARWLVDRRSPTTARAIVNRVWQAYFGTGFVATSEDFGLQGDAPSHPELLDWLAVELMENGWSLKHLHRLIVHSHTYRQSSRVSADLLTRDPGNRLLARGARFRVDAEVVRDIALAASGLLNPKVGGPSVYPPAPGFLFQPPASYGPKKWEQAVGADQYRRALYTFRFRSILYPVLEVFDAPNGDTSCVRRPRSNTPLQALATLNEPLFVECAKSLARQTFDPQRSPREWITLAFKRCVARLPTEKEVGVLVGLLDVARHRLDAGSARQLVGTEHSQSDSDQQRMDVVELAAWTAACRVILNLDETFTRE